MTYEGTDRMACATKHYRWRADVSAVVQRALRNFPGASANTYIDHPWPGWDALSVDYWDAQGCGWPIQRALGYSLRRFLMDLPGKPDIRHTIYNHTLWTPWAGYQRWGPNDHSGRERHLHVTYLP